MRSTRRSIRPGVESLVVEASLSSCTVALHDLPGPLPSPEPVAVIKLLRPTVLSLSALEGLEGVQVARQGCTCSSEAPKSDWNPTPTSFADVGD